MTVEGIVSKVRVDKYGRTTGGKPLARGALYKLLQNRIYRGQIVHKDKHYPGKHEAIVDQVALGPGAATAWRRTGSTARAAPMPLSRAFWRG